jgi:hypothetical protein
VSRTSKIKIHKTMLKPVQICIETWSMTEKDEVIWERKICMKHNIVIRYGGVEVYLHHSSPQE